MKVSVIGTGYVGLISAVGLADVGHNVICVGRDQEKVKKINQGIAPIYEKNLKRLLHKHIGTNLSATTFLNEAIAATDITLIAVGTPFDGHKIDLRDIEEVSRQIGRALASKNSYHLVVVKSTVVPGTTDSRVLPLLEKFSGKKAGEQFGVGMNPEFLREGKALEDVMFPDRIVLGGIDKKSLRVLSKLYEPFGDIDIIKTNTKTAEMIKYAANSFLATTISFSNEIGNLCATIPDVDVVDVMRGVHLDKRLSPILPNGKRIIPQLTTYLEAGCGFGGSCFPKDVKALISYADQRGYEMRLLKSVMTINAEQPQQILSLLHKYFSSLEGKCIAVLGLAFKPDTDDMRESPAIPIVNALLKEKAIIQAYDPVAVGTAKKIFANDAIGYQDNFHGAIKGSDAVIVLTSWKEFKTIPQVLSTIKQAPLLIDGRRFLNKSKIVKYAGIGL